MYGFMFKALERLVKNRFGDHSWKAIVDDLDLDISDDGFKLHQIYPDALLNKLIASAIPILSKVQPELNLNPETLLEMFGDSFFNWTIEYRYDNLLKILGSSLVDFLTNLDALHDHLGTTYTGMNAPSFRCTEGEKGVIFLHYYSVREGLYPIVIGIVKAVARQVYHYSNIDMVVVHDEEDHPPEVFRTSESGSTASSSAVLSCTSFTQDESLMKTVKPVVFRITVSQDDPDRPGLKPLDRKRKISLRNSVEDLRIPDQNFISPALLCRAFPFHVVFDRGLLILQMGASLQRLIYRDHRDPVHLDQIFEVVRPRMPFSFNLMVNHINGVFILRTKRRALRSSVVGSIRLKGQMLYDQSKNIMLFLCSPRIGSMTQLKRSGLYLSDIPIHDATRDLILQAQTSVAEFRLMQQMETLLDNLKKAQSDLKREKLLTDRLLYSILPESAANALRQGRAVPVENFDNITILFSDIKGFTNICGQAQPLQVVRMLHEIYMRFDQLVAAHGVYKVETIGDAYMVVGGLPETCENHAERIARQALDMRVEARKVLSPHTREPLEIRIGIHSGGVMAGVVGQRMPRYCLFGNTVNIASRTESTGEAGRIHITQSTYELIKSCREFGFEKRWPLVQMKGVSPDIQTFFLLEQRPHEKRVSVENYPELSENSFFEEPDIPSIPDEHFMCRMCECEVNDPVEGGGEDPDLMDDDDDDDDGGDDDDDDDDDDDGDDDDDVAKNPLLANAPTLEGRRSGEPSPMVIHRSRATPLEQDQVVTAVLLDRKESEAEQDSPAQPATGLRCPFTGMLYGGGAGAARVQPEQPKNPENRIRKNARPAVPVLTKDNVFRHSNAHSMHQIPDVSNYTPSQLMDRKLSREMRSLDLAQRLEDEHLPRAIPIRLRRRESALCQLIRTYSHENVSQSRRQSTDKREMKIVDMHTDHNGNSSASGSLADHHLVILRPMSPSLSMPSLLEYEDDQFLMYLNDSRRYSAGRLSSSDSAKSPSDPPTVPPSVVDVHPAMLQHFKPQESSTPKSSVVSSASQFQLTGAPLPPASGLPRNARRAAPPCSAGVASVGTTTASDGDAASTTTAAAHADGCQPSSVCSSCAASPAYIAEKRAMVKFSRASNNTTANVLAKSGDVIETAGSDDALPTGKDATVATTTDATLTTGKDATVATGKDATAATTAGSTLPAGKDATMSVTEDSALTTSADATLISGADSTAVASPNATAPDISKDVVAAISADAIASNASTAVDAKKDAAGTVSVDSTATVLLSTDTTTATSTDTIDAGASADSAGATSTDDAATANANAANGASTDSSVPARTDKTVVTGTDAIVTASTDKPAVTSTDTSTNEGTNTHGVVATSEDNGLSTGAGSTVATSTESAQAASKSSIVTTSMDSTVATSTSATVTTSADSTVANRANRDGASGTGAAAVAVAAGMSSTVNVNSTVNMDSTVATWSDSTLAASTDAVDASADAVDASADDAMAISADIATATGADVSVANDSNAAIRANDAPLSSTVTAAAAAAAIKPNDSAPTETDVIAAARSDETVLPSTHATVASTKSTAASLSCTSGAGAGAAAADAAPGHTAI